MNVFTKMYVFPFHLRSTEASQEVFLFETFYEVQLKTHLVDYSLGKQKQNK